MRRAYLFIYSPDVGTRDEVKDFIDACPEIVHWRYDLPNAFYLISDASAVELYTTIQRFNAKRGRFLICEAGENKQGWLPKKTWTLLNTNSYQKSQAEEQPSLDGSTPASGSGSPGRGASEAPRPRRTRGPSI
ncbi:MAG: hypothetical protein OXP11_13260 [Gammaproteobacteria bacterium]|nr:hypothetical protein [Gammaproteobacteria bacterium]